MYVCSVACLSQDTGTGAQFAMTFPFSLASLHGARNSTDAIGTQAGTLSYHASDAAKHLRCYCQCSTKPFKKVSQGVYMFCLDLRSECYIVPTTLGATTASMLDGQFQVKHWVYARPARVDAPPPPRFCTFQMVTVLAASK